jgi:hypothetical protein
MCEAQNIISYVTMGHAASLAVAAAAPQLSSVLPNIRWQVGTLEG